MIEQPASQIEVDQKFCLHFSVFTQLALASHITVSTFSEELKRFILINGFIRIRLIWLEIYKSNEDDSYILGYLKANLSNDNVNRVIKLEIRIYISFYYIPTNYSEYKILQRK